MAGGVNQVYVVITPGQGGCRGGNGYAPLSFQFHPVHFGRAVVDFADLVQFAGVEEQSLGHGGLARIDVGNDSYVSDEFNIHHGHRGIGIGAIASDAVLLTMQGTQAPRHGRAGIIPIVFRVAASRGRYPFALPESALPQSPRAT